MGISTGIADKKSTKIGKNDKTEDRRWNMLDQKSWLVSLRGINPFRVI